jgi:hypothetical protein
MARKMIQPDFKNCSICGQLHPKASYLQSSIKQEYGTQCNACRNERKRQAKHRDRELYRAALALHVPAKPYKGTATPPRTIQHGAGTYRTGDGEVQTVPRPGSLRAYSLPSRGIGA